LLKPASAGFIPFQSHNAATCLPAQNRQKFINQPNEWNSRDVLKRFKTFLLFLFTISSLFLSVSLHFVVIKQQTNRRNRIFAEQQSSLNEFIQLSPIAESQQHQQQQQTASRTKNKLLQ
jgi:hypothetical protein